MDLTHKEFQETGILFVFIRKTHISKAGCTAFKRESEMKYAS